MILAAFGLSCSDSKSTPTAPSNPAAPITSVSLQIIGLPSASVGVGQAFEVRALQVMSNGATSTHSTDVIWTSSVPGVASISATGAIVAKAIGTTTIGAAFLAHTATATLRVVDNWTDLDFRVSILNSSPGPKSSVDVLRAFAIANDILLERTGSRMRLVEMRDVENDVPITVARNYMDSLSPSAEAPDGVLIWTENATAVSFGAYAQTLARPAPYTNRFPATVGPDRLYVAAVHYEHKFSRCGYDTTGGVRISERSGNGECSGRSGLVCVDNGRFWECPDARLQRYGNPDVYLASTIVHEFMHPAGTAGNDDHYGSSLCVARTGMSGAESVDSDRTQLYCAMCPDVVQRVRPTGAPAPFGTIRRR